MERLRALRASCQDPDVVRTVGPETVEELFEHVINGDKLCRLSAECLSNLAAGGAQMLVWRVATSEKRIERALRNDDRTQAAIVACAYNCSRAGADLLFLLDAMLELEGPKAREWVCIVAWSLCRERASSLVWSDALLEYALLGVNNEPDSLFNAADDVAVALCRKAETSRLALEVVADASQIEERGALLRAAGAIEVAGKWLDEPWLPPLKIVANVCLVDEEARELAREFIPKILNCSKTMDVPLCREWAVFATRNVCQDNDRNRKFIADLQPQAVAEENEALLKKMIDVTLDQDPETGRNLMHVAKRR